MLNRAWFEAIMYKVIARMCLRVAVMGVEDLYIVD